MKPVLNKYADKDLSIDNSFLKLKEFEKIPSILEQSYQQVFDKMIITVLKSLLKRDPVVSDYQFLKLQFESGAISIFLNDYYSGYVTMDSFYDNGAHLSLSYFPPSNLEHEYLKEYPNIG